VQPLRPELAGERLEAIAGGRDRLPLREGHLVERRAHIEARASDHDGEAAAGEDVVDRRASVALVERRRVRLAGLDEVDAVVRHATFGGRRLRRADVHASVDLHGVG
jgi:hypothetical protein